MPSEESLEMRRSLRRLIIGDLKEEHEPKGTAVLAWIFLATFAVYYFLNWKFLSALWHWR